MYLDTSRTVYIPS